MLQHFKSVHFVAPQLADAALARPAMLYFVFNPHTIAVLVAHNIAQGEWVAQLPFFPGLQDGDALDAEACASQIAACIGGAPRGGSSVQFDVVSCGSWAMSAKVAQRLSVGRVHLLGYARRARRERSRRARRAAPMLVTDCAQRRRGTHPSRRPPCPCIQSAASHSGSPRSATACARRDLERVCARLSMCVCV